MRIGDELLSLVAAVCARRSPPKIRRAFIPEPNIDKEKDAEFGLIELADGASGLFYAWLGESQRGISAYYSGRDVENMDTLQVAELFAADDDISRSLGLAAINAISQSCFARWDSRLPAPNNSLGGVNLRTGDRLGMVGHFPSLVRQARTLGVQVTVIERKRHMVRETSGIRITLDPAALSTCNKIICTAATLINDSIDEMLGYCGHADSLAVIGPSASFFPDPLFRRKVDFVGGTRIVDVNTAIANLARGQGLGDCSQRYALSREGYPGSLSLAVR